MPRLVLTPDTARWERQIDAQFRTLAKMLDADAKGIARNLDAEVPGIVAAGLDRQPNPGRHSSSLSDAIRESIAPIATGRKQYGIGIRVTDPAILTRLAVYWHAIEVGSDHIVGIRVVGFGTRQGNLFSAKLTPPGILTGQPDAIASRSKGAVVRNPIREHKYLETVSDRAIARFTNKVDRRLTQIFS